MASLCLALVAFTAEAGSSRPFELKGSIEYASTANQHLLVYSSNEVSSGPNIYGRALGSEGAPLGRDFRLSTQTGEMSKPDLAYGSKRERFLAVWGRKLYDEDRAEIIGRPVGPSGAILGGEFRISFSTLYETRPSIAYCPGRDRFLVTWTKGGDYDFEGGNSDVYGQLVDGDGSTLIGSNFVIASGDRNQFKSDVSCDVVNDRFLAVWEDQSQLATLDDIQGQLISTDGALMGASLLISGTANIERRPVVAANTQDGTYLVVWEYQEATGIRLLSQKLDSNGHPLSAPVPIGATLGGTRNRAAVAYLKPQNEFLVVFFNSGFNGLSDGIYGQFVEANGNLRQSAFALTTADEAQYRPDVTAGKNTFFAVWTDYRDTVAVGSKHNVYEYYGRIIGNDMVLSARWRNPESQ